MRRLLSSFLIAFVVAFPFLSFANGSDNSLKALKGTYAYNISGEFGPTSLSNTFLETGIFKANGKGGLTAHGNAVINGQLIQTAEYTGTYTVNHRIVHANVIRTDSDGGVDHLSFILSIGEKTDTLFIQAEPQPLSAFAFTNIKGDAAK